MKKVPNLPNRIYLWAFGDKLKKFQPFFVDAGTSKYVSKGFGPDDMKIAPKTLVDFAPGIAGTKYHGLMVILDLYYTLVASVLKLADVDQKQTIGSTDIMGNLHNLLDNDSLKIINHYIQTNLISDMTRRESPPLYLIQQGTAKNPKENFADQSIFVEFKGKTLETFISTALEPLSKFMYNIDVWIHRVASRVSKMSGGWDPLLTAEEIKKNKDEDERMRKEEEEKKEADAKAQKQLEEESKKPENSIESIISQQEALGESSEATKISNTRISNSKRNRSRKPTEVTVTNPTKGPEESIPETPTKSKSIKKVTFGTTVTSDTMEVVEGSQTETSSESNEKQDIAISELGQRLKDDFTDCKRLDDSARESRVYLGSGNAATAMLFRGVQELMRIFKLNVGHYTLQYDQMPVLLSNKAREDYPYFQYFLNFMHLYVNMNQTYDELSDRTDTKGYMRAYLDQIKAFAKDPFLVGMTEACGNLSYSKIKLEEIIEALTNPKRTTYKIMGTLDDLLKMILFRVILEFVNSRGSKNPTTEEIDAKTLATLLVEDILSLNPAWKKFVTFARIQRKAQKKKAKQSIEQEEAKGKKDSKKTKISEEKKSPNPTKKVEEKGKKEAKKPKKPDENEPPKKTKKVEGKGKDTNTVYKTVEDQKQTLAEKKQALLKQMEELEAQEAALEPKVQKKAKEVGKEKKDVSEKPKSKGDSDKKNPSKKTKEKDEKPKKKKPEDKMDEEEAPKISKEGDNVKSPEQKKKELADLILNLNLSDPKNTVANLIRVVDNRTNRDNTDDFIKHFKESRDQYKTAEGFEKKLVIFKDAAKVIKAK